MPVSRFALVDIVIPNAQPHQDGFTCDLRQSEQGPAVGSREAPCHRIVRSNAVNTQRFRPWHSARMRTSLQRRAEYIVHRLGEQLAVLLWQPTQIRQEARCPDVLH